ncbi:MAG TPA: MerR family transcriptional regulator [Xanthobacteraceae bacterium]|nr:MerR family transcriptional regulator [Xanthobacteraceae bacterium]
MAEGSTAAVEKAPGAFRTISEVAQELEVPQHVLRFWESRFREIRPMKRGGGRRYYRPDDLDLLRGIRHLLYGEGYTIRGVQRLLREQGVRFVQNVWQPGAPQPARQTAEQDEGIEQASADDVDALPFSTLHDVGDEPLQRSHTQPAAGVTSAAPAGLAAEEVQKLRVAVQELTECRRLLEAALREKI